MIAPEKVRAIAAQLDVADALTSGWPAKNTPYARLVQAERRATRLTTIGYIPGTLLDMEYITYGQFRPSELTKHRNALQAARQELVAARLAAGELQMETLLRSDAMLPIVHAPSNRIRPQLARLLRAMDQGWQIRIVLGQVVDEQLPARTYDVTLVGDPEAPVAAYRERSLLEPHEFWETSPEDTARAARVYTALSQAALTPEQTHTLLAGQLAT